MKKVLILAYDFLPHNSIASQRPASWLKYLPEENIEPTIVTLHWDNKIENTGQYAIPSFSREVKESRIDKGRIVRVPFRANTRDKLVYNQGLSSFPLLRKSLSLYYLIFRSLLSHADNTIEIYRHSDKILAQENFDFIIATGEPFILFKYASQLSKKHKIPWVADYRDTWTNNPNLKSYGVLHRFLAEHFFRKLEKKYVKSAKLITTPAPSYKKLLQQLHPHKRVEVIYNGSDINDLENLAKYKQRSDVFEIAYAGRFYPHQQLEVFLEGYLKFIIQNNIKNSRLVFYGLDFFPNDKKRLLGFDKRLADYIVTTQMIDYKILLQELRKANLLLLLSEKEVGWLNAKIFDYLPLQRKILLVCNDYGILEKIIDECNAGLKLDTAEQVQQMLEMLYEEFKKTGRIEQKTENFEKYTRENQATKLAVLIKESVRKFV